MASASKDEYAHGEPNEPRKFADVVATKWLSKCVGREVELYLTRSPKVQGVLREVDERFGRCIVETEHEDVIVWLGQMQQVRIMHDNGHPKARGGSSK